ncbi:hypothetical protein EVAR_19538_1 [Eumeta japonica]|uniref:Uncharacterized protein n=1 Tax=Eumeta variegata TaxID=151549 RepID=A0A4C1UF86_EUMVA|nr:hypothetical protein EVAR_19538_1 [Eumeta japonica]
MFACADTDKVYAAPFLCIRYLLACAHAAEIRLVISNSLIKDTTERAFKIMGLDLKPSMLVQCGLGGVKDYHYRRDNKVRDRQHDVLSEARIGIRMESLMGIEIQNMKVLFAFSFVKIRTIIGSGIRTESETGNRIENGNRTTIKSGCEIENQTEVVHLWGFMPRITTSSPAHPARGPAQYTHVFARTSSKFYRCSKPVIFNAGETVRCGRPRAARGRGRGVRARRRTRDSGPKDKQPAESVGSVQYINIDLGGVTNRRRGA